ncbi:hypothetical protein DHEL01_v203936 [Diaporthe helianthi]|uniref:Uncharacterized protein n=1 Tax=Diaporthe helianthi TaxID=158607 RepID=A0A2P5I5B0_DIAHE|nr:hypothetical protein DHEL01_v203936 [Diaporthe helianthi]
MLCPIPQIADCISTPSILSDLRRLRVNRENAVAPLERVRAEQLIRTPEFQTWIQSPASSQLLVDGYYPGHRGPSGLSFVCLSLADILARHSDRFIPLAFFCGLHTDHESDLPHLQAGGRALIRSFIYQLLGHMNRFVGTPCVAVDPRVLGHVQMGDLRALTASGAFGGSVTPKWCRRSQGADYEFDHDVVFVSVVPTLAAANPWQPPLDDIILVSDQQSLASAERMAITVTSLQTIVSTGASATQTSTLATTLTITPNPLTTAFEPPPHCTQSYLSNCQTDAISGTYPRPGKHVLVLTRAELSKWVVDGVEGVTTYGIYSTWCEGTVTAGEQTMIVNGLSQCPALTSAFTLGDNPVQLSWLNAESTTMSISGKPVFTVSAERVALLYRSSDVTAASGASSSTAGGGGSPGAGSGSGSSGDSGLSAGAVAGIAIGAAVVGMLFVLGFFWLCLRRRKNPQGRGAAYDKAGGAHLPPPAVTHVSSQAPPGAMHELKANSNGSTPVQVPAGHVVMSNATELLGSTPSEPQWAALPPRGVNPNEHESGGGRAVFGEVPTSNDYYQLSGTFERSQGPLDNSRQNTPIDLVSHGVGGRGFPPEKVHY